MLSFSATRCIEHVVLTHAGAAAAVACGVAHFALATDFLGEAVVPAAYCGLYCYRGTLGMVANNSSLRREGAGLSGAVSLMASDPAILMKAAQALGSPGAGCVSVQQAHTR